MPCLLSKRNWIHMLARHNALHGLTLAQAGNHWTFPSQLCHVSDIFKTIYAGRSLLPIIVANWHPLNLYIPGQRGFGLPTFRPQSWSLSPCQFMGWPILCNTSILRLTSTGSHHTRELDQLWSGVALLLTLPAIDFRACTRLLAWTSS